jgi:hypothetical protein
MMKAAGNISSGDAAAVLYRAAQGSPSARKES